MSLLRKLHTLTEIGAMVVNGVASVVSAKAQRTDASHADRIEALEQELAELRKHATRRRK